MKKHILIVSQYFYPESFRINDIALEWVKRGYKVTVLTGIPNYPEGKFYKGYNWFKKRKEMWNGIEIIRIPIIARGKNPIQLIMNYYSFVISGRLWSSFTRIKPDLIFTFEVSPMTQALIGKWFAKRRKIPNYLYVQDLWPENLEVVGGIHNKTILNHYQKMSDNIYKYCTKIFATSPSFVEAIRNRVEDKEKVLFWPQYAEDFYKPIAQGKSFNKEEMRIVFTGNVGYAQGLDVLPKVAKEVSNVKFVIVGDGRYKTKLIEEIKEVKDKFVFIDRVEAKKIPEILASCDIAFLSFMNNELFKKTIPAKLQSYMACGMPILAAAEGETERIIKEADCGECSILGDVNALVKAIENMKNKDLEKCGKNSVLYYNENFNKTKLFDFMNKIIGE